MADYESDLTRFMRRYLAQHPEELASQKKGRAAWWDKDPDARTAPSPARHSPRAGGAEYTFCPLSEKE
ncbi:MAG: DUF3460 family protein [Betaproteobacteria bacterium]|nr:DUF3460 family protein [Betaproteobacteria bacterium]